MKQIAILLFCILSTFSTLKSQSIAREWNELLLESIRKDFARPTVHARNLYHVSAAMYDAWAVYDTLAKPYFLNQSHGNFSFSSVPEGLYTYSDTSIEIAISYACYRLLKHRFSSSPNYSLLEPLYDSLMSDLGLNTTYTSININSGNPADLGNLIAFEIINYGLQDGSNEQASYTNQYYSPVNAPLIFDNSGNPSISDPNRWQPLSFDVYIDQSGNEIPLDVPDFLSPEWGNVAPFSLHDSTAVELMRNGQTYKMYHDPGLPPFLSDTLGMDSAYQWGFSLVSTWSSHLDPADTTKWDISPASVGGLDSIYTDAFTFYDYLNGGDVSSGRPLNPATGMAYASQEVPRADYARVLAEFWADGPDSETPPGHWFTILNYVNDHPSLEKKYKGEGHELSDLEWDIKSYFMLGGAMHDAAISAWGIKGYYDYIRPVSAIRFMAEMGQSSDSTLPNFHLQGLPLVPGYIELIDSTDALADSSANNINEIKIWAWKGPSYILDPATDVAGVGWILAKDFMPYQRPTFVTPPFAGYVSGHSTYSRAAAEILTQFTGDAYFPGGMGEFFAPKDSFLVFEKGPSVNVTLQWATYRDASDQCSLSRIWGGIHPPADDLPGRIIGEQIGKESFEYAEQYFYQDQDNDGFLNSVDCNDLDSTICPTCPELCDGIDNDCDGLIDDSLQVYRYYLDADLDSFGSVSSFLDTCSAMIPEGYVLDSTDCNDLDSLVNPSRTELCDGIDQNCNLLIDEGLSSFRFYLDSDLDGFGNPDNYIDTCHNMLADTMYVSDSTDCNDMNALIFPGSTNEIQGEDYNCSGLILDLHVKDNENISVYPNPFDEFLRVEVKGRSDMPLYYELRNVLNMQVMKSGNLQNQVIPTQQLTHGVYQLIIFGDQQETYRSILIK